MSGSAGIDRPSIRVEDYSVQTVTAWMREAAQQLFRHALEVEAAHGIRGELPVREQYAADRMIEAAMDCIRANAAWNADPRNPSARGDDNG